MVILKQMNLINELMWKIDEDEKLLCKPVIDYLLELGYSVKKRKKSTFTIEFEKYGRVIAKLEHGKVYKTDSAPHLSFWLRFSASNQYTKVFQDAVNHRPEAWVKRGQYHQPKNFDCCGLCKGKPKFYHYISEDGTQFDGCGGYTKRIHDAASKDVPDILRMIKEQDEHFKEMFT